MATALDAVDSLTAALREAGVEVGHVGGEEFRKAVATRLLSSEFFREAMSEAWDEGLAAGMRLVEHGFASPNPYRH